ncbi:metastasis-associated protein MTA1 isoform X1 [Oncorhynchus mykiss]|uniref:metastasis-associated protein MTA1 isoform X1 n=1 Tax=Oncorhynchus mykiss TaxID=8022 RepID=UPI000B4F122F|nr:metastasis-associated protein MTA1 isoform X1 [Oncorhynchus mykiss]
MSCCLVIGLDMLRVSEGQVGRPPRIRTAQRSTLASVLQFLESRPAIHAPRSHRTLGLQAPPPRRLLSSLPYGPHGLLGKRSFHHHTRAEPEKRPENPGQTTGPVHNGRSSGGGGTRGSARGGVMIRKRRPNLIDAPDDSFFVVSRETRRARRLLSRSQLRRACRQPCEQITLRKASQALSQGPLLAPPHPHPSLRMRGPIVIHD